MMLNRKQEKPLRSIFCSLLCLAAVVCVAGGAYGATIDLQLPEAIPTSGTFVAPLYVSLDAGAALGSCTLNLTYDASVFLVTDVQSGGGLGNLIPNLGNAATGAVVIGGFNLQAGTDNVNDVYIADVTFEVVGSAGDSSAIAVEATTLADVDSSAITAATVSETVEIPQSIDGVLSLELR